MQIRLNKSEKLSCLGRISPGESLSFTTKVMRLPDEVALLINAIV